MSYSGKNADIAEQRVGRAGMIVWPSRLDAAPGQLIDASGVQFDDMLLRKEAGAESLDDTGLASAPTFTGTYSVAATSAGVLAAFKGAGTPVHVKAIDSESIAALTNVLTLTIPVGGVPADNLIVLGIAQRRDTFVPPFEAPYADLTIVDSKGNTYALTLRDSFPFGSGTATNDDIRAYFYYSRITTPLIAGDTITITASFNTSLIAAAEEYTNIQASPIDRSTFGIGVGEANVQVGPLQALQVIPTLLFDVQIAEGILALPTLAPTNGFTARGTAESTFAGRAVQLRLFERIDTSTPTIIGQWDFNPQDIFVGLNTVSTVKGSTTVTGAATSFLTTDQANSGDSIRVNGEAHRIATVTSDTVLDTVDPWHSTNVAQAYTILRHQRLFTATADGNIYQDQNNGTTVNLDFSNPVSGLVPSNVPGRFVVGGRESGPASPRKLFWFSGRNAPQVFQSLGGSFTDHALTSPPADWSGFNQPVNAVFSGASNRLGGFGNINDPHRVYFSLATDHEDFLTTPSDIEIYSGIGDRLFCGISFDGLLFFWKFPLGIFWVDDSDETAPIVRRKSEALGCAPSPHAALAIDRDVLFMAADCSFHLLSAVSDTDGARASDLSFKLGLSKWLRENVNLGRLDQVVSVWYAHKKQAFFGVPSAGSDTADLVLRFDFGGIDSGFDVRFAYSRRDSPGALALRRSSDSFNDWDYLPRPIVGEAGKVYVLDQPARTKDDQAYTGTFQTPHLDLAFAQPLARARKKVFEFVEFVFEPVDSGTLVVQPYVDGVASGDELEFDPTRRRHRLKLNVSDGHTISFVGTEEENLGDFAISDIIVWFRLTSEDQSRGT